MKTSALINLDIIPRASRILVGVSGGADSIALLYLLNNFKHDLALEIIVAHYDHALRHNSSKDSDFVANVAKSLSLKFITERNQDQCPLNTSIEAFARQQRFNFFVLTAKKLKISAIALAHNKEDLAETVLMRILRGAGLYGLRAILPSRMINGVLFLRPLLNTKRNEIEMYLTKNKVSYIDDPTNSQDIFLRNKIRHKLVPYIKNNFSPAIVDKLAALASTAAFDYEYLEQQSFQVWKKAINRRSDSLSIKVKEWELLPKSMKRILLRQVTNILSHKTDNFTLEKITVLENFINNSTKKKSSHKLLSLNVKITNKFITLSCES